MQRGQEAETFTVKAGLRSLIRDEGLLKAIDDAVSDVTQLQWEAAKIMQLYVLRAVRQGLPMHDMDRNFFWRALVCAQGGRRVLGHLNDLWAARDELYRPHRDPGLRWVRGTLRTQLLKMQGQVCGPTPAMISSQTHRNHCLVNCRCLKFMRINSLLAGHAHQRTAACQPELPPAIEQVDFTGC